MKNESAVGAQSKSKTVWRRLKRIVVFVVCSILVGAIASAVWHARRTAWAEKHHPPLGEFADVGGHKLHFHLRGTGPSVVMDSGNGEAGSYAWFGVEEQISAFAHVLTYDRAGTGWSEAGPAPRTSDREVEELRELLQQIEMPQPYILVGHSRGGFNMRLFASKYPDEVAGLVLVDAYCTDTFPDDTDVCSLAPILNVVYAGRHFGLARLFYKGNLSHKSPNIQPDQIKKYVDMQGRTSNFESFVDQSTSQENWQELRSQMRGLGDMPVTVIAAKLTDDRYGWKWWPAAQKALAANVGDNVELLEPECGHYVQAEQPELLVDTVRNMLGRISD